MAEIWQKDVANVCMRSFIFASLTWLLGHFDKSSTANVEFGYLQGWFFLHLVLYSVNHIIVPITSSVIFLTISIIKGEFLFSGCWRHYFYGCLAWMRENFKWILNAYWFLSLKASHVEFPKHSSLYSNGCQHPNAICKKPEWILQLFKQVTCILLSWSLQWFFIEKKGVWPLPKKTANQGDQMNGLSWIFMSQHTPIHWLANIRGHFKNGPQPLTSFISNDVERAFQVSCASFPWIKFAFNFPLYPYTNVYVSVILVPGEESNPDFCLEHTHWIWTEI